MSLKTIRGRSVFFAAAVATALSLAVPASAELPKVKVSGTIEFTPPADFHGRVNAKNADCKAGARVNLWRFDNAADTTGDKLGTDKASKNGAWGIMVPNAQAGDYQIQIPARKVGEHDFLTKCVQYLSVRMHF